MPTPALTRCLLARLRGVRLAVHPRGVLPCGSTHALDRLQHAELSGEDEMMIQRALQRIDVIASVVDIWGWIGEEEGTDSGIGWTLAVTAGDVRADDAQRHQGGHQVKRCPNCETLFLAKNVRRGSTAARSLPAMLSSRKARVALRPRAAKREVN